MGIKSIPLKKFKKFLKHIGCVKVRTQSSHEVWDKFDGSLQRPIVVDNNYKDVPMLHIHTCLRTLGISKEEFEKIISGL
jgi:predicted RNA binding protein YcfA (HicA-like mRNA interferase family)